VIKSNNPKEEFLVINLKKSKDLEELEIQNDNLVDIVENNKNILYVTRNPYNIEKLISRTSFVLRKFEYEEQEKILIHAFNYCNQYFDLIEDVGIIKRFNISDKKRELSNAFIHYSKGEFSKFLYELKSNENKESKTYWIYEWIDSSERSIDSFVKLERDFSEKRFLKNNMFANFSFGEGVATAISEGELVSERHLERAKKSLLSFIDYGENYDGGNKKGSVINFFKKNAKNYVKLINNYRSD